MSNLNVHEFVDKVPDINDIVPTQSNAGPRKYTWASLMSTILKFVERGSTAPTNNDKLWVMPDGRLYFHNGTTWVSAVGAVSENESHDYVVYVSPTGDNAMFMKGNSHYPALTIAYVIAHATNTNDDIVTLFAGIHQLSTAGELFRSDRTSVFLHLLNGSKLRNNNLTSSDMIVSAYSGYSLTIKGPGAVDFDGVTYFIKDDSSTKLTSLNLDFELLNCTGTSANWDKAIIETSSLNTVINIKRLSIQRTCPVFLFKNSGSTYLNLESKIDILTIVATGFTAYHPGVYQFDPTAQFNSKVRANIEIGTVRHSGAKQVCLFRLAQYHLDQSLINFRVKNFQSTSSSGATANADYSTSYTTPALVYLDKSNLPTQAHTNSIINIFIDSARTAGSLLYINDLVLNWTTVNIFIKGAMCTHATPIVINNVSGSFSAVNIYADIHHIGDANSPIAIIKNSVLANGSVKVRISGNLRNSSGTKGCIQVCTGTRLELHDLFMGVQSGVAAISGQSASTQVIVKNVATNSTTVDANIVENGETILKSNSFNK